MDVIDSGEQPIVIPGEWRLRYAYAAGEVASRFLRALEREARLYAVRCPRCSLTMIPPRAYCERCFVPTEGWIPVGPEGRLESFTIVAEPFEGLPPPPYAIAYVTPDGAGTAMCNFLQGLDLTRVADAAARLPVGMRVRARFNDVRAGRVTDFVWEPA